MIAQELTPIPVADLELINATDASLALLRNTAIELSSTGTPDTKEGYDQIHKLTMVAVKVRTESGKLARALAAPHKERYDTIITEGKRIGDHAKASEDMIRPLKDQYEERIEAERKERDRLAAAKIQARTQAVIDLGMVYDETGSYSLGEHSIDAIDIQAAPDEEWNELLAPIIEKAEADRLAIETRRQELLAEQQRETDRLIEQKKQQDAEALELQRQRIDIDRQQADLRKEQRRIELQEQAKQAEVDRIAREEQQAEQARLDAIEADNQRKQEKAETAAKLKADKERTGRLRDDKKQLREYSSRVCTAKLPEIKNVETTALMQRFCERLTMLLNDFDAEIDAL